MSHIEKRRNLWYAKLTIPADVRDKLGKLRFVQSLGTPDKRVAEREVLPLLAKWKAQIEEARGNKDAVLEEAERWKKHLLLQTQSIATGDKASQVGLEVLQGQLAERAQEIEDTKGEDAASRFFGLATGSITRTDQHFLEWKGQLTLAAKTIDQATKDVRLLCDRFPDLQQVNRSSVREWMREINQSGKGVATQKRILSFCRNYWGYLESQNAVPEGLSPFEKMLPTPGKKKNGRKKERNLTYTPSQVVDLWEAASVRPLGKTKDAAADTRLADLILLGAYTGARIEELCSIKLAEVSDKAIRITDSKTEAGHREIPIHSALLPVIKRLTKQSDDGYLLSGLTFNKYGDRSNAIGKRFGRLKTALGFDTTHTFHSFRSTLITLLENKGVSENLAADIVGHEKNSMTYGLYSGGASLKVKKEAIERVRYPFKKKPPNTAAE